MNCYDMLWICNSWFKYTDTQKHNPRKTHYLLVSTDISLSNTLRINSQLQGTVWDLKVSSGRRDGRSSHKELIQANTHPGGNEPSVGCGGRVTTGRIFWHGQMGVIPKTCQVKVRFLLAIRKSILKRGTAAPLSEKNQRKKTLCCRNDAPKTDTMHQKLVRHGMASEQIGHVFRMYPMASTASPKFSKSVGTWTVNTKTFKYTNTCSIE